MKGFTLIELMIVMAIVGILVAIILPIISSGNIAFGSHTSCKRAAAGQPGVLINVDVNGYESQLFGPDGLPIACR